MADISDVSTYLANAAAAAIYPNGTAQPSVASMDVRVFEGWPNPDQLDRDLAGLTLTGTTPTPRAGGQLANVSVLPMLGANVAPYQLLDKTHVIRPAVHGLTIVDPFTAGQLVMSGTPVDGEYLTVVVDRAHAYSGIGPTLAAILADIAAQAAVDYPGATSDDTTLTIPNTFFTEVRNGGVAVLGKVSHRQRQSVMVTTWAPTHTARTAIASAIDKALKQTVVVSMPDTSQAVVTYNRTNVIDEQQMETIYRRDLIYDVEYATVTEFPGYVVTTIDILQASGLTTHAIT